MPVTKEDIRAFATNIAAGQEDTAFINELRAYAMSLNGLTERCRELAEMSYRCWNSVQQVPSLAPRGRTPDQQVKAQVEALRRRLRPKLQRLKDLSVDFQRMAPFDYLKDNHKLRGVKHFKSKSIIKSTEEALFMFERAANRLLTMDEVRPMLHERAAAFFHSVVGQRGDEAWSAHVGWEVPTVDVHGTKLGPYVAITRIRTGGSPNPMRRARIVVSAEAGRSGGYRKSMPWLFPTADANVVFSGQNWYWHTHVNHIGEVCFGDMRQDVYRIVKAGEYWSLVDMLDLVLCSWNPDSPHCQLVAFNPDAKRTNWSCVCGRTSPGPEPVSAGGQSSFVSCMSCASDVCSHCMMGCTSCGMNALCMPCQRYIQRADERILGPLCQDCHDATMAKAPDFTSDEDDPSVKEKAKEQGRDRGRATDAVRGVQGRWTNHTAVFDSFVASGAPPGTHIFWEYIGEGRWEAVVGA